MSNLYLNTQLLETPNLSVTDINRYRTRLIVINKKHRQAALRGIKRLQRDLANERYEMEVHSPIEIGMIQDSYFILQRVREYLEETIND
jgi:hypothetical protein